ncbi:hypothetical protein IFM89_005717 [Coptis chinensis]|uniref:F-box/kelch-repeat protein n=1 Tax=Coptis chinensis TaxID=261450 RepID=A0A835I976_9MAGN|nr:hypothetical protein IFM89_005717 [Coptis chinensis]
MEIIPGLPDDVARGCLTRIPREYFSKAFEICKAWKTEIDSSQYLQQRKLHGFSRAIVVLAQAEPGCSFSEAKYPPKPSYHLTVFEPETGTWSRLPAIPSCPNGLPFFCQCAGVGRRYLVVIGGWNPTTWMASKSVFVYDFVTAKWKCGADMVGPVRSFFGCASDFNRTVFVAGGHDDEKNALRSALAYDVIEDKWVPLPDMARQRDECKGVFHGGKFHAIGGYCTDTQGKFEKDSEVFDVEAWKWCHLDDDLLHTGMYPRNCVVDEKGKMFRCYEGNVAVLDGSVWREMAALPNDVRVRSFVVMWREKMLVIGSSVVDGVRNTYLLEFTDNKQYKWTKVETPKEYTGNIQAGCSLEI